MRRVKKFTKSLVGSALIIGFALISNACTGQSPLGISYDVEETKISQELPDPLRSEDPNPPPPPADGDE